MFQTSGESLQNIDKIARPSFFTTDALAHVVEEAAIAGVEAQVAGNPPANRALSSAHHLMALYLGYAPNENDVFTTQVGNLFNRLNSLVNGSGHRWQICVSRATAES